MSELTTTTTRPSYAAKCLAAWVIAALHAGSYLLVATFSWRPERDFSTVLDPQIPFLPWTIWLYMPMWIAFFHVVLALIPTWRSFVRCALSVALASVLAYVIFLWFPSSYPRPDLVNDGTLTAQLFSWVRAIDRANNTFPSLHVAIPFTLALSIWHDNRRAGLLLLAFAVFPALATLTVKQHYVVDVVGGVVLAVLVHVVVFRSPLLGVGGARWHELHARVRGRRALVREGARLP
jgi:membrane-associated phospholipid phosphatase